MKQQMRACHHIEIVTPKRIALNGLWLGPKKPKRVVVWVHGLGSNMFSKLGIADELIDGSTAVLTFNNRGHDKVTTVSTSGGKRIRAGSAHELFTDCIDDIQGAVNLARRSGARDVYVAGHSTGCQKSIYYASKKPRGVRGIIILGPVSDYDAEVKAQGAAALKKAERVAHAYVGQNKKHVVLSEDVWKWPWIADAQRFLSLYTGKSVEEIFTYWAPAAVPKTLRSVRLPILVLLANKEEFSSVPAKKLAEWFEKNIRAPHRVIIVPKVTHSFKGGEGITAGAIRHFMKQF